MERFKEKKCTKKIICIIIVLMLCNFIIPTYNYAVSTEDGGSFFKKMAQVFCLIPDAAIGLLQNMFVSTQRIEVSENNYQILYSSGTIFAGEIPAFDINFIDPGESKLKTEQKENRFLLGKDADAHKCIDESMSQIMKQLGYATDTELETSVQGALLEIKDYLDNEENWDMNVGTSDEIEINEDRYVLYCQVVLETARLKWFFEKVNSMDPYNPEGWVSEDYCEYDGDICDQNDVYSSIELYIKEKYGNLSDEYDELKEEIKIELQAEISDIEYEESKEVVLQKNGKTVTVYIQRGGEQVNNIDVYHMYILELNDSNNPDEENLYHSSAGILQPTIATWYNALRKIAIVGLLSVILYIGIRIVLSSTSSKDKAKYKNMLKNWLVALCLVFVLHYIMNLTIIVVTQINEVVGASAIGQNGEDVLMSSVRNKIANPDYTWGQVIAHILIYCVLVIYTIIFTIQYFRRVIYIGFLTVIAPLITLTYPLDKIKDGKSQAFDMWLKDYIFLSLIQVLHLLIYYVFLSSSLNLANEGNWLFALVAIGFITKAEKLMKKMFGFEKSSSMGAVAAGATGALVMNAINKIPRGSGAKTAGKEKGNSTTQNIRTVTNPNVLSSIRNAGRGPVWSGQPSPGQPSSGQPSSGQPSSGQPSSGQPSPGQPSSGQPSSGQPSSGQPSPGQPSSGQPSSGQPSSGQPGSGQPGSGQPSSGQPSPGQPSSGQPSSGQPSSGQPSSGQPSSGQPSSGQPSSGQPSSGQPSSGQPGQGQPSSGQPRSGQPGQGQPSSGQPSSGQPSSSQPGQGQPSSGQPGQGQPSSGQPSSGQPSSGQPSPGQPSPGQPSPGQPSSVQPEQEQPVQSQENQNVDEQGTEVTGVRRQRTRRQIGHAIVPQGIIEQDNGQQESEIQIVRVHENDIDIIDNNVRRTIQYERPQKIKGGAAKALYGRYHRKIGGAAIGVLTGGTGALIAFSSILSKGEIGAAVGAAWAGGKAGYNLGVRTYNGIADLGVKTKELAEDVKDTYNEGAYGIEYAQNEKFDRDFRRSKAYKDLRNKYEFPKDEFDKKIQKILDSGITDVKRMDKILKNHKKHPRKYNMENSIMYSQMAENCKDKVLYNQSNFIRFCRDQGITDLSEENIEKLRKCIIEFK